MADEEKPKEEAAAAENTEGNAEGAAPPPPENVGQQKKIFIIAGVFAFILIAAGGGYWFFVMNKKGGAKPEAEKIDVEKLPKPLFVELPEIFVNLSSPDKRTNFLKLTISLEAYEEAHLKRIEQMRPRIIDHLQVYLRQLRIEDLRGSMGLQKLREEILLRVNTATAPIKVKDVLFKEMLIQ